MFPQYDHLSYFVYLVMGFCMIFCIWKIKQSNSLNDRSSARSQRMWYALIVALWSVWAAWRYLNLYGVGGMDAITYATYFKDCFRETGSLYHSHLDLGFQWLFKLVRLLTDDYHFLFALLYAVIAAAYVSFVKEFSIGKTNYAPYILLMFFYVLGFNTMRTTFGIALILFSFVLLNRGFLKLAFLLAFSTALIHKACLIYAMALPFYLVFQKRRLTSVHILGLITVTSAVGVLFRDMFIDYASTADLNGAYASYARRSVDASFFDGAWRQAIEQLLLLLCVILSGGKVKKHIDSLPEGQRRAMQLVYLVCVFDFILIPVNYYIGNWRAHEFLGVVRVVMWGEVVYVWLRKLPVPIHLLASIAVCAVFILRMYISFQRSAESGGLMPYFFEPLMNAF